MAMDILPKFAPKTARKQDASVLAALAQHDMQLTLIQIHILEPHARQLRVSQPRINQELAHDHVGRVACVPNGFVKADQFMIGEQFREPLLHLGRRDGQYRTRMLENLLQVLIIRPLNPQQSNQLFGHLLRRSLAAGHAASRNEGRARSSANCPYGLMCPLKSGVNARKSSVVSRSHSPSRSIVRSTRSVLISMRQFWRSCSDKVTTSCCSRLFVASSP